MVQNGEGVPFGTGKGRTLPCVAWRLLTMRLKCRLIVKRSVRKRLHGRLPHPVVEDDGCMGKPGHNQSLHRRQHDGHGQRQVRSLSLPGAV